MDPFMASEALAIFGTSLHAEKLWLAVLRAPAGGWRRGTGRFVGSVGKQVPSHEGVTTGCNGQIDGSRLIQRFGPVTRWGDLQRIGHLALIVPVPEIVEMEENSR